MTVGHIPSHHHNGQDTDQQPKEADKNGEGRVVTNQYVEIIHNSLTQVSYD